MLETLMANSPDHKHQAHNKTVSEMKQLREKQANGEKMDKIPANQDASIEINEHESHLVHVLLEKEEWLRGKKISKPRIQKFYQTDFDRMSKSTLEKGEKTRPQNAFGEYDTARVLHDPRMKEKASIAGKEPNRKTKKLKDMSIEELREKYMDITGNDAGADDTEAQLIALINEAQQTTK